MECSRFSVLSDLDSLERVSRADLDDQIRACPGICFILFGEGNQDIFGIGLLISYIISFILAIIYGPYLFITAYLVATRVSYSSPTPSQPIYTPTVQFQAEVGCSSTHDSEAAKTPSPQPASARQFQQQAEAHNSLPPNIPIFTQYLLITHQTAIYTQLLSTLAITVACIVRRESPSLQSYESVTILSIIAITLFPMLMTLASNPARCANWWIFLFCLAVTVSLALYAVGSQPRQLRDHGGVQKACLAWLDLWDLTDWRGLCFGATILLVVGVLVSWGYLVGLSSGTSGWRWRRTFTTMGQGDSPVSPRLQCGCYYCGREDIQRAQPRWVTTLAKYTILVTTLLMIAAEFGLSALLIYARKCAADRGVLGNVWHKEMEWGFGQIIAPFSWAPLLIELGSAVIGTVRYHRREAVFSVLPALRCKHHVDENNGIGLELQRRNNGMMEGRVYTPAPAPASYSVGEA
ncbi:hypothetical protein V8F20_011747 [Naviculisporaceae sp. PSN 640]